MNKPIFIFKIFLFLLALSATSIFAQTDNKQLQADACYEVVLQILIGSDNASEKNAVPPTLSTAVKKLKTLYAFSDYRLTTTFLQRTSGSIEYKSLLNGFGINQDNNTPVFSEWSLRNLRNLPGANGRRTIQFDSFRFGARIPVLTGGFQSESGKTAPIVNYEQIGVTTMRLSLNENEPTVVGSLAASKPEELMFLILTVKPVE